jgi:DNA-binding CsgD family transcriptional regulator
MACTTLAEAPANKRQLVHSDGRDLLLRPAGRGREGLSHPAAVIAMQRIGLRENASAGAAVLARQFGLSAREAALAESLSRGVALIEAGRALQLTPETTRNYSKRIYAKTGASGQADLVRLVLTSLAPLA